MGKTTIHARIFEYSKLVRVPVRDPVILDSEKLGNICWDVTVKPARFDKGLADFIHVAVSTVWRYDPGFVLKDTDVSIEILDETGENTVFRQESNVALKPTKSVHLCLSRRELEASSCLHNDSFTVRCTLSERQATKWWCLFTESKKPAVLEPEVAMAGSHMLTIGSFFKLKAALRNGECTYSTHFTVAGCRWYFKFNPAGVFGLFCVSNNKVQTTAEFSFEVEGVVNYETQKMTHNFDGNYSRYFHRCRLEPISTSGIHDRLIVRCHLAVIPVEKPPAAIRTATTPRTESILTPLLSAMYD